MGAVTVSAGTSHTCDIVIPKIVSSKYFVICEGCTASWCFRDFAI